jgi:hypothetical protein
MDMLCSPTTPITTHMYRPMETDREIQAQKEGWATFFSNYRNQECTKAGSEDSRNGRYMYGAFLLGLGR